MSGTMSRVLLNALFTDTEVQDGKLVYIFDKKQHAQTLLHNLIVMQDNDEGSLTDVIIISKDDELFHFHGPILAALSKTLEENLLKQGLGSAASKNSKIVMKEDFSSEAVQCLWDYAYTSVVTLTPSNINEVKKLAEHYGIDSLSKECTELLNREDFGEGHEMKVVEFKDLPEVILSRLHNFLKRNVLCTAVITDSLSSQRYPCHGAVIAAACTEFFLELVFGDSNRGIIDVNQHTLQVMDPFLQFLYTAKLTIDQETVLPLIEFAAKFNIPSLVNACCHWLKFTITANNALSTQSIRQALQYEDRHVQNDAISDALDDLYQYSRSFVLRNFLSVTESIEYLVISSEELIDLVADEDLGIHSEEEVVFAIMKWVCSSPEARASDLPILLQAVRLEYIPVDFLETMLEHDLMINDSLCIQIIEDAKTIRMPSRPRRCSTMQQYNVE